MLSCSSARHPQQRYSRARLHFIFALAPGVIFVTASCRLHLPGKDTSWPVTQALRKVLGHRTGQISNTYEAEASGCWASRTPQVVGYYAAPLPEAVFDGRHSLSRISFGGDVTTGLQTASSGDMQQRLRRLPATQELASCAARSTHGSFCHMQQRLRRRPATQELASARRHARVSPDAAQLHADIQATRGMFPHAALGHARPATPTPAPTQHGRAHTSGHTGTQAHTHTHTTHIPTSL